MTQVENQRPISKGPEDFRDPRLQRRTAGDQQQGVEITLQRNPALQPLPSPNQGHGGIQAQARGAGFDRKRLVERADPTWLRARAEALGIHERVTWLGWRRDLPRLYPAIDVLLLTSHDEGTPVAVFEALVSGTPVVARDVGGVAEVLTDGPGVGPAGVIVPRDASLEAWAALAIRTAAAPAMSRERRAEIARRFSVERLAEDIAGLYAEEIARRDS